MVLSLLFINACSRYPQVSSEESLKLIQRFHTACNTKNQDRLERCREELKTLVAEQKLSTKEEASFQKIISLAESNDWESAAAASLKFAKDQVHE